MKEEAKHVESEKLAFVTMETFNVNLLPDPDEKFLQLGVSMQKANEHATEGIKSILPALRSRVLLLLTNKHASDIATMEGKKQLSDEITVELKKPLSKDGKPNEIADVFFTSFVMNPVVDKIYLNAYQPLSEDKISMQEALDKASVPLKQFMLKQTCEGDLALFAKMTQIKK